MLESTLCKARHDHVGSPRLLFSLVWDKSREGLKGTRHCTSAIILYHQVPRKQLTIYAQATIVGGNHLQGRERAYSCILEIVVMDTVDKLPTRRGCGARPLNNLVLAALLNQVRSSTPRHEG
jgi:hypothetical protein